MNVNIQGGTPTGNGGNVPPPTATTTPLVNIKTNEERFDYHITNVKIVLLWFIVIIAIVGIPATWFYDKRLTIEIIVTIITGVVGWFSNQLKQPQKKKK